MTSRARMLALSVLVASGVCAASALATGPEYSITSTDLVKLGPLMQRQIASLQYLMNGYQLRQFFRLPDDEARRQWIIRFWRANDPTPTTPENEMRTEHYLRVDIARADFGRPEWPGWDKRGEVMIRYGFPDYRGELESEVTARKVHPPGELWFYRRHQMMIRFSDFNLNGNYIYDITPFGDAQDSTPDLAEFLVYDTHQSIQEQIPPQYLDMYRAPEVEDTGVNWTPLKEAEYGLEPKRYLRPRMEGQTEDITAVTSGDWLRSLPNNPSDVFQKEKAVELAANFQGVLEDTPSSYPFNFQKRSCPFYFDVEQFRGGEGVNRVEVNLEVLVQPTSTPKVTRRNYTAEATVMDENYNIVGKQDQHLAVPTSSDSPTRLMPAQVFFTVPSDYYRVAVTVTDTDSSRSSAYRTTVHPRDFDHALAMSDILFAQRIAPVSETSPFARGPIEVIPHPIRRYAVGSPVSVYFEIYNLGLDQGGQSGYEVQYRVVPHTGKKQRFIDRFNGPETVVSSSFKGSGFKSTEPLHVAIKSENLKPGLYDFLITIKDEYWQSIVHRAGTFRIVEPSKHE
ncbi:MAG TPA: GWxTD domain-containing protein [Candidatus Krumholzibacteria bacterium]|nr:GWxTD domain-containing protein [Candidatus Krumholzibacteria bacterium]